MPVCTFFGHHDCPEMIKTPLKQAIMRLIEEHAMDLFYVGNQGYVTHSWGGAAKFAAMAEKQGKHVINLAER